MHNDSLEIFVKVVEYKSFSAASRVLYISPVAIRKHIDKLEKELGVSLFKRSSKGVILTEKGEILYAAVKKMQNIYDECLLKLKADRKSKIRVGLSRHFLLGNTDIVFKWLFDNNNYQVDIVEIDESYSFVEDNLDKLGKEVDILIGSSLKDLNKHYQQTIITFIKPGLLVPKTHKLINNKVITIKDIKDTNIYVNGVCSCQELNEVVQVLKDYSNIIMIDKENDLANKYQDCIKENNLLFCTNYLSIDFIDASIIPLDFAKPVPFSFVYLKTCDYEIKHFANCMKENYNKYYEQKIRD